MNNEEVIEILGNYLQLCKKKETTITFFLGSGASVPIPIISNLIDYIIDWIAIKNLVVKIKGIKDNKKKAEILEILWNNWLKDSSETLKIIGKKHDTSETSMKLQKLQNLLGIDMETAKSIFEGMRKSKIKEVLDARAKLIEISILKKREYLDEESVNIFFKRWSSILKIADFSCQTVKKSSKEDFLPDEDIRCLGLLKELLKEKLENKKSVNIEHLLTLNRIIQMISKDNYSQTAYKSLFAKLLFSDSKKVKEQYVFRDFENLSKTLKHLITTTIMLFLFSKAQVGHKAIANFITQLKRKFGNAINFYFITTNYDLGIEIALCEKKLRWQYSDLKNSESNEKRDGLIIINKVHGSVNLLMCPKCNKTRFLPENSEKFSERIGDLEKLKENYVSINGTIITPECGCGHDSTEILIIAPATIKEINEPVLYTLSNQAREMLTKSNIVFAIGYGFSDGDLNIIKLLQNSINENIDKKTWVPYVIVSRSKGAHDNFLEYVRSKERDNVKEDVIALFIETLTEEVNEKLFKPLIQKWCSSKNE